MIKAFEAALEIHSFLAEKNIPYVVIGGLSVQYWGEPRLTRDVDITVLVPVNETDEFVNQITKHFHSRVSDALEFALTKRMVLIKASNGYEVDISLGVPGYEDEVMRRAVDYEFEPKKKIRLCSAEDLIIHKAVASRPRDIEDIEGIISRQSKKLDKNYIKNWLKQFSEALEKPIDKQFENLWNQLVDK